MKFSSLISYFFAGAMLTNSVPHFVIGLTGRRNMTPFGRDSSPLVNVLWGAINFVGGCLLVLNGDRQASAGARSRAWPVAMEAGSLLMSLFMIIYKLTHRDANTTS